MNHSIDDLSPAEIDENVLPADEDDLSEQMTEAGVSEELWEKLQKRWDTFAARAVEDTERVREYCDYEMTRRHLPQRIKRNMRRAGNKLTVAFKDNGDIDESYEDGYASIGIGPGLSAQAVAASAAYRSNAYFERNKRWFEACALGRKEETKDLTEAINTVSDYWTRLGDFESHGRDRMYEDALHGTAFMRYYLHQPMKDKLDPQTGAVMKVPSPLKPFFRVWPIQDIFFTNMDRMRATDQEGVGYITRGANILTLEEDEAVYETTFGPDGQPIARKRTANRFINLKILRTLRGNLGKRNNDTGDSKSSTPSTHTQAVSNFPQFDLIEWKGSLSPETLDYFTPGLGLLCGIRVNMPEVESDPLSWEADDLDEDQMDTLKEYRARLARIRMFELSYLRPQGSVAPANHVVQMNVSATGRNELYVYGYMRDGEELFRSGICDLGDSLERIHADILNAQLALAHRAGKPPVVIDESALLDPIRESVRNLLRPGKIIAKQPNRKLADFMEVVESKSPPDIHIWLAGVREAFFDVVRVLPAIMGGANANTFGQDQLNSNSAQSGQDDVLLGNAKEDYRMLRDMHEDYWNALNADNPHGYLEMLIRVGGYQAINLDDALNKLEGLWDDIYFDHPTAFGRDPAVLAQDFDRAIISTAPFGKLDGTKVTRARFAFCDMNPDDLLIEGHDVIDPDKELEMMMLGNKVTPSPGMTLDEIKEHIAEHTATVMQLEAGETVLMGHHLDPEDIQYLTATLEKYVMKANVMMQMAIGQMNAQMGGPPGMQGPSGGGGKPQGTKPQGQSGQSANISASAHRTPAPEMAAAA